VAGGGAPAPREERGSILSDTGNDRPRFALTLQALPNWGEGDVPPIIRLRRFLKAALRSYGLRCTEIRETPPEGREVDGSGRNDECPF
jgi:hypothetical protein